jgi:hypothetical protein
VVPNSGNQAVLNEEILHMGSSDPKTAYGIRLQIEIGDLPKAIRFKSPAGDLCLSIDILSERLKEDNWKMNVIKWEISVWAYTKGHTLVNVLTGEDVPGGSNCVSTISITYR